MNRDAWSLWVVYAEGRSPLICAMPPAHRIVVEDPRAYFAMVMGLIATQVHVQEIGIGLFELNDIVGQFGVTLPKLVRFHTEVGSPEFDSDPTVQSLARDMPEDSDREQPAALDEVWVKDWLGP